jgi:hypothetical protein
MPAFAQAERKVKVLTLSAATDAEKKDAERQKKIVIEAIEPGEAGEKAARREVAWLGVSTDETSEALTAQLGLQPGEGLVVLMVAKDSPAAKAGLQKNDVLVEFDGQQLVHPAQFRKLVQMRKENDEVKLAYYRGGKKQTVTVSLGKTTVGGFGFLDDTQVWPGKVEDLHRQLRELPLSDKMHEEMQRLRESLAEAGIDKDALKLEIQRSVEAARDAVHDALRHATNAQHTFGPAAREFRELTKRRLDLDKDATITVKSHKHDVRTMVKTDDTGTYVVVANPKKHLTAHDKEGKLTFDGAIETPDQQEKVPADIWTKVQPMMEQLKKEKTDVHAESAEEEREGT